MTDLPLDRDRALASVAAGWGRTPSTAHPLCRCGKPKPPQPRWTARNSHDEFLADLRAWIAEHGSTFVSHYDRRDCAMHKPEGRR